MLPLQDLSEADAAIPSRYDLFLPPAANLPKYMRETKFQNPQGQSAFEFTYQKTLWEHLGVNPDQQRDCAAYMAGRRGGQIRWLDVFPVASQLEGKMSRGSGDDNVLLVDIGGNQGHDLKIFRKRFPDLPGRLILQDLPEAVNKIPAPLEGIEVMPYNFFTPQLVKGMVHWSAPQR